MVRKRKRQSRRMRHRKINLMNMANSFSASNSGPNPNPSSPTIQTRRSSSPRRKPSSDVLENQKPKKQQQQPHHQEQEPSVGIANHSTSLQDMFDLSPDIVRIVDDDDHRNDVIIDLDADDDDDDVELQRALLNSSMLSRKQQAPQEEEEEVIDVKQKGILRQSFTLISNPTRSFGTTSFHNSCVTERGDSSVSFMGNCVVCNDAKPYDSDSLLRPFKCGHRFCDDCIKQYVSEKLQESIHVSIICPGSKCEKPLRGNYLKRLVPERLYDQWATALIESSVLSQPLMLFCPFEDCSKCLVDDEKGFLIRACPHCWKIFCVRCQVSWHLGMTCAEFQQRLREEEIEIESEMWAIRIFQVMSGWRGPVYACYN